MSESTPHKEVVRTRSGGVKREKVELSDDREEDGGSDISSQQNEEEDQK